MQVDLVLNVELEAWLPLGNQHKNRESRINAQFRHGSISFDSVLLAGGLRRSATGNWVWPRL